MLKPVCPKCGLFYKPKRNGWPVEEGKPHGDSPVRHVDADGKSWTSYKLWIGDLWECRGCSNQIIIGALSPVKEHYQPDYESVRDALGGDGIPFVHDC